MNARPFFSVIFPTYQRRELICDAVRAFENVEWPGKAEIIVVVDGSTDGTADALRILESPWPLKIVEQPNSGPARARNRGAQEAAGDILLFLDDDMLADPALLLGHAQTLQGGADVVLGDFPVSPDSVPGFLTESIARAQRWRRSDDNIISSPFDIFSGHFSARKAAFEAIGGFDETFTKNGVYGNEDIDFGCRLLKSFRVRRNPSAIARQRHVVPPRSHMERAAQVAQADLLFASKHPELADELFRQRGRGAVSARLTLLSRLPVVPRALALFTVKLSDLALRTPFRSSRKLAYLFSGVYLVNYWSALRSLERRSNRSR